MGCEEGTFGRAFLGRPGTHRPEPVLLREVTAVLRVALPERTRAGAQRTLERRAAAPSPREKIETQITE